MKIIAASDEKDLLVKLREGDKHAFHAVYNLYADRLSGKLIHLLRSEELAEDILQDMFVKVWEMRDNIDPDQNFAALLYKMAANMSKNIFRRNLYDELMRSQIGHDNAYNPIEDSINKSGAKTLLDSALSKLTPRQREVYILHKLEGRSYEEISTLLKISSSAINHHIQEASKQLKSLLKKHHLHILIPVLAALFKK